MLRPDSKFEIKPTNLSEETIFNLTSTGSQRLESAFQEGLIRLFNMAAVNKYTLDIVPRYASRPTKDYRMSYESIS
jgi:hypothetical protein